MTVTYTLFLYERLAESTTGYIMDLTSHAPDWVRTIRAVGGFWSGDFTITPATMHRNQMIKLHNLSIGRRVVEYTAGVVTWEGEIVQMDLTIDGVVYRRTMDLERWHNRVKVMYTDNATNVATATAWSENTDSSDIYGENNYIDVVPDNYDATSADALRDRRLLQNAFPKSVPVGGLSFGQAGGIRPDSLHIFCAGYVHGMNRRYRESDTVAAAVSTQITTLIGESEFVTAGTIDTNATMNVPISGSDIPFRLWDGIEDLVLMGDTSGNRWIGGVYSGRVFDYNLAATTVSHYWRDGRLVDLGGVPQKATQILPDIIVQGGNVLLGNTPPGGNVWDNPRNAYIEEVVFIAPDGYRLIPYSDVDVELSLPTEAAAGTTPTGGGPPTPSMERMSTPLLAEPGRGAPARR